MNRQDVYKLIDGERDYQNSLWPARENPNEPNPLTVGEFLLLLEEYVQKARSAWVLEPKPEINTLDNIRKIAGIAVNCMEQHETPARKLK